MTRYVLCGCCGCSSVSAAAMAQICGVMEPNTDTLFCWRDMQPVLQSTTRMLTVPVCHRLGFKQARSPGSFRFVDLFLYDLDLDAYVVHAPSESDDRSEAESGGSSVARSLMITRELCVCGCGKWAWLEWHGRTVTYLPWDVLSR